MKRIPIILLSIMLGACGALTRTDYQRPDLEVPPAWLNRDTGTAFVQSSTHWWDNFQDPLLSRLITQMLETNNDLAIAGIQLQLARVSAGLANTNLTPDVSASGGLSETRNMSGERDSNKNYSASFSLSYELDLWGKLARIREQARWQVEATAQDRQATALALIGTTAQLYWQIANANQQIDNLNRSLELAQQTLRLVESSYNAGAVSRLDFVQAQQTVLNRENQLTSLVQQREAYRNAMAILFNQPHTRRVEERMSLDIYQQIPIAQRLPLDVIAMRPDVQASEWRLRAMLAGSDAARLSFYPSLSLGATVTSGSDAFHQWFNNPIRTLAGNIALPFLQWNTVRLTIEQSNLQVQQAAIEFRDKAYTALSEVDNAMTQRLTAERQKRNIERDLELSQERLRLAESRYRAGAVSYQTLLDAQDALLSSENSLSDTQYNYLYATLQLWLSMGGGTLAE